VEAILRASEGQCEVPVQWSTVAAYFATRNMVEGRWWSTYSTLLCSAAKDEVIEETQQATVNGITVKHVILRSPKKVWTGASWGVPMVRSSREIDPSKGLKQLTDESIFQETAFKNAFDYSRTLPPLSNLTTASEGSQQDHHIAVTTGPDMGTKSEV
jgi:hypothetical protein